MYNFLFVASFACMLVIPTLVFPVEYFDKKRVMALSVVTTPVAAVTLILPPITVSLLDAFGWRLTLMIMACLSVQVGCIQ